MRLVLPVYRVPHGWLDEERNHVLHDATYHVDTSMQAWMIHHRHHRHQQLEGILLDHQSSQQIDELLRQWSFYEELLQQQLPSRGSQSLVVESIRAVRWNLAVLYAYQAWAEHEDILWTLLLHQQSEEREPQQRCPVLRFQGGILNRSIELLQKSANLCSQLTTDSDDDSNNGEQIPFFRLRACFLKHWCLANVCALEYANILAQREVIQFMCMQVVERCCQNLQLARNALEQQQLMTGQQGYPNGPNDAFFRWTESSRSWWSAVETWMPYYQAALEYYQVAYRRCKAGPISNTAQEELHQRELLQRVTDHAKRARLQWPVTSNLMNLSAPQVARSGQESLASGPTFALAGTQPSQYGVLLELNPHQKPDEPIPPPSMLQPLLRLCGPPLTQDRELQYQQAEIQEKDSKQERISQASGPPSSSMQPQPWITNNSAAHALPPPSASNPLVPPDNERLPALSVEEGEQQDAARQCSIQPASTIKASFIDGESALGKPSLSALHPPLLHNRGRPMPDNDDDGSPPPSQRLACTTQRSGVLVVTTMATTTTTSTNTPPQSPPPLWGNPQDQDYPWDELQQVHHHREDGSNLVSRSAFLSLAQTGSIYQMENRADLQQHVDNITSASTRDSSDNSRLEVASIGGIPDDPAVNYDGEAQHHWKPADSCDDDEDWQEDSNNTERAWGDVTALPSVQRRLVPTQVRIGSSSSASDSSSSWATSITCSVISAEQYAENFRAEMNCNIDREKISVACENKHVEDELKAAGLPHDFKSHRDLCNRLDSLSERIQAISTVQRWQQEFADWEALSVAAHDACRDLQQALQVAYRDYIEWRGDAISSTPAASRKGKWFLVELQNLQSKQRADAERMRFVVDRDQHLHEFAATFLQSQVTTDSPVSPGKSLLDITYMTQQKMDYFVERIDAAHRIVNDSKLKLLLTDLYKAVEVRNDLLVELETKLNNYRIDVKLSEVEPECYLTVTRTCVQFFDPNLLEIRSLGRKVNSLLMDIRMEHDQQESAINEIDRCFGALERTITAWESFAWDMSEGQAFYSDAIVRLQECQKRLHQVTTEIGLPCQQLVDMGFPETDARRALQLTGYHLDSAIEYLIQIA